MYLAQLGYKIDSRDALTASQRLDRMNVSAGRVDKTARGLNRTFGLLVGSAAGLKAIRRNLPGEGIREEESSHQRTRGSPFPSSISAVSAQTSASARSSGVRPLPSIRISVSSASNTPQWVTRPCS